MASSGASRRGLLTAGGISSILAGMFEIVGGGALVALVVSPIVRQTLLYPLVLAIYPPLWPIVPTWLIIVGVALLVLGTIAIAGGVSAVKRKMSGLSLAGAICALPSVIFSVFLAGGIPSLDSVIRNLRLAGFVFCALPSGLLGILAIIFVVLGKREFGAKV